MNDLMAMLGGGAAPAAPLPSAPPGQDPLAAALMGGAPADPAMGGMPMDPAMMGADEPEMGGGMPSTDPAVVHSLLEQLVALQQGDQQALVQEQMATLMGDPLFQALIGGGNLGPGAGQDAQAIGPGGDIAPDPMMPY